jgi:hypothetical protein
MKKKLVTAVTLAACAVTPLFAQNVKQGVITFALNQARQTSVSVSSSTGNAGRWEQGPKYYSTKDPKTAQAFAKVTTSNIVTYIAAVLHKNPSYYSMKPSSTKPAAQLVLVQGELGGFFGIGPDLADAQTDLSKGGNPITGNNDGFADDTSGTFGGDTRVGMFVRLATGRHIRPVPPGFITSDLWPLGHHQPWGQIFVRDSQKGLCENVTPFFSFTVQECYDCYFLNSFVTDAKFTYKEGQINNIPPCCGEFFSDLTGTGVDRYYLTMTFDNTYNNPYLNDNNVAYVGNTPGNLYFGVVGIGKDSFPGDGITPDYLEYTDAIRSGLGKPGPYVARFTLNGYMVYSWSLKFLNSSDTYRDFIGTATYTANGYGFIGLICSFLNGTVGIAEGAYAASKCCLDIPWYDSWYGVGWNNQQHPWGDPVLGPPFFWSPMNVPASLSQHVGFNQAYEPRWQWPQFGPDPLPTQPNEDTATRPDPLTGDTRTFVPGSRWHQ